MIIENNHGNVDRKQLIFGIHSCDVNAILLLDRYFLGDYKDPYYLRRRENTVIAALTCEEIGDNCFCESFGTGPSLKEGYDLLLTDVGDRYLVEVGSKIGEQIVQKVHLSDATTEDFREKEERLKAARAKFKKKVNTDNLAEVMLESFKHNIWTELKDTCQSVGSCSLVCPTCFCFSVHDTVDLTLEKGERWREWDSCQLLEYAEVALGGILYHSYKINREGIIVGSDIVPPTAHNANNIEKDLWQFVPNLLNLPLEEATLKCEMLIRAYDPCISCSTHFLRMDIREVR